MDEPVRFIGLIQVGITVFAILIGAVGEPLLSDFFEPPLSAGIAFAIAFAILTYLSVILGELVPKAVALQRAERIAVVLAVPLDLMAKVARPIVWLLQVSANSVLRVLRVKPAPAGMIAYTREDIRHSVARGGGCRRARAGGGGDALQGLRLRVEGGLGGHGPAARCRRHLRGDATQEALRAVVDSPYTRYPVFRETLDDVVGIMHVRDLFAAIHDLGIASVRLGVDRSGRRTSYPETKDLAALLADFRREKQHLAIVIDEYGDVEGIVTLEDVLEEIVGDIEDEFDLPDTSIERIDETRIRIAGTYTIDDFNEEFDTNLEHEDFNTVAGLVFGELGRAPEVGDEVRVDGLLLRVLEIEGSRMGSSRSSSA